MTMQTKQNITSILVLVSVLLLGACNEKKTLMQTPKQTFVNLNPDWSEKLYLNEGGSGVIVTLIDHTGSLFTLADFGGFPLLAKCPTQTNKKTSKKPIEYIKTLHPEFCETYPGYQAGKPVSMVFDSKPIVARFTLCLLDDDQPGKADCGDGYKKRSTR
ncbi:hypothetical protein [Bathymodiolus thermophilus thioautotrophic gill symbiont]|uniref:hypothetical protein n=1 Tax=Bathymodiolus thermophilus thioautotrophic gill symbiont TaxID=2360 RepID=UPI001116AEEE|nr:hypothetical protein [Bathymodiolus thermophilus thioautotrophic gill symbiont]